MSKIFIIDDDHDMCHLLSRFLTKNGFDTAYAHNAKNAVETLKTLSCDLILCDYKVPGSDGTSLLQKIKILKPAVPVIIITGYADLKIAVETLKKGACDYVTKPLYPDEILETIKSILAKSKGASTQKRPQKSLSQTTEISFGPSQQSVQVKKNIDLIAPTDLSVIVTGETGTGKEYVATAIHQGSKRANKPFVAIDCGAIPKELAGSELFGHKKGAFTGAVNDKKGSFELANSGSLFLDEIGNLSYENQVKLLRVIQERCVRPLGGQEDVTIDVRLIVATNDNLKQAVRDGRFREDIYHRLNEFQIELAPLAERPKDIIHFAKIFLEKANEKLDKQVSGFCDTVIDALVAYDWPGNLRELQNIVRRAVLLCTGDTLELINLPEEIRLSTEPKITYDHVMMDTDHDTIDLRKAGELAEKKMIVQMLEQSGYNKSRAARMLKIDRKTLYNKLRAYEISV
ncbi:MAG: sigma-54 dependent transcriptional regulator [Marinoscillum sp.]